MDLVARWLNLAHNSHIFCNSRLHARLESGKFQNMIVLGDSGYAFKSYVMTLIQNQVGQAEMLFNESQIRTRIIIKRSFGV